jgi:hypothetical protein
MDDSKNWFIEQKIARTVKALEAHFFSTVSFSSRKDLVEAVMGVVNPGMTVGIGGSVTVRDIGLPERLQLAGARLFDHWQAGLTREEINGCRVAQLTCDLFITGANAITETGELVNMDGIGNRVSAMTFGPKKVIIIAGHNKIVPDVTAGLDRIRRVAAPLNHKRLNIPVPCAKTGYCHDCTTEARMCRVISIMQRRPVNTDISVYLLNEEMGF